MLAENLTKFREAKKYSKTKLAKECGLTARCIEFIEHGISKSPRLSTLEKIANALDVSVDELIR